MKFAKLSLAAMMALGVSAYALDNVKLSGHAKFWFETNDTGEGLFDRGANTGDFVLNTKITGDKGGVAYTVDTYASDTLGLGPAGDILGGYRHGVAKEGVQIAQANVVIPVGGKTIVKAGWQELQTPFAFTEKWNSIPNTFNAAVVVNNSIAGTTLVGAYVGKSTGTAGVDATGSNTRAGWKVQLDPTDMGYGAYMAGVHTGVAGAKVNGYFYNLTSLGTAYWADASAKVAGVAVKGIVAGTDVGTSNTAFAVSAATKVAGMSVSAAYSSVGENGIAIANIGTNMKKTKLPTATVYGDGFVVAQPDTQSYKIKAVTKVGGAKLIAQYGATTGTNAYGNEDTEEFDIIAVTKLAGLNVKALYINQSHTSGEADNRVRLIVSKAF